MKKIAKLTLVALAMLVANPLTGCASNPDSGDSDTPIVDTSKVNITFNVSEGGTIDYAQVDYKIGDTLTLRANPDKGYSIAYVKVNDKEVRPNRGVYKYKIAEATLTVSVKFEKNKINVNDFTLVYDDETQTAAIKEYKSSTNRIPHPFVIPEEITNLGNNKTYKITKILETAFANSGIESLVISKNIEEIELRTFTNVYSLETISVDDNNPIFADYDHSLYSKDYKTLIAVPYNYQNPNYVIKDGTELIGESAFENNRSIVKVEMPNSIKALSKRSFMKTSSLKEVKFSNKITTIPNEAFSYSNGLKNIVIPEGVLEIGNQAFNFCTELENVTFPTSLKTIGIEAFYRCQKLENPTLNEGLVTIKKSAFGSCSAIISISMPSTLIRLEEAVFEACSNLTTLKLNHGLQYLGGAVLVMTPSIKELVIPNTVTTISYNPFIGTGFGILKLEDGNKNYVMKDGLLYSKDLKTLICVPYNFSGTNSEFVVPNHVNELACNAFSMNFMLTKVTLPTSIKKVNAPFENNIANGSGGNYNLALYYEGTMDEFEAIDTSGKRFDYLAHFKFNIVTCSDGKLKFSQN